MIRFMLSTLQQFLMILRWKNLLIVVATQYLMRYGVLEPSFAQLGLTPALTPWQFFLLSLDTVLIAAGGYMVDDLLDAGADALNKPGRNLLAGKPWGWHLYAGVVVAGAAIAVYLAWYVGQPGLVVLYPLACVWLWAYSYKLEHLPVAGNLTVALFCAFVVGIVVFAEREAIAFLLQSGEMQAQRAVWMTAGFGWFAFLTTLLREIVKDAEDEPGDRLAGSRTIATVWGLQASKAWAMGCTVALVTSLAVACWLLWRFDFHWGSFLCGALIGLPTLWLGWLLIRAESKSDFHFISSLTKLLMVTGLLLTLFL